MPVKGVIFDVSGTLVDSVSGQAVEGVIEAVDRLVNSGLVIVVVNNDGPKSFVENRLRKAGIHYDHVLTRYEVGKAKMSPAWVVKIKEVTGFQTNELIYVGDSDLDMITASRGNLVYIHAEWSAEQKESHEKKYGLRAPSPQWVAAIIEHIFSKKNLWWWNFEDQDAKGRQVRQLALVGMEAKSDNPFKRSIIKAVKDDDSTELSPYSMKTFLMIQMIASLYEEGITEQAGIWTTYPRSTPGAISPLASFLDVAAKLFRRKYYPDLLIRHTQAQHSNAAFHESLSKGIINQLNTVSVNPARQNDLKGKSVLVIDDFIAYGTTTESGRNLLLQSGVSEVISVGVGKYGDKEAQNVYTYIIALSEKKERIWSPFVVQSSFENIDVNYARKIVQVNQSSFFELYESYLRIHREFNQFPFN